jgi:hypothetical protein
MSNYLTTKKLVTGDHLRTLFCDISEKKPIVKVKVIEQEKIIYYIT